MVFHMGLLELTMPLTTTTPTMTATATLIKSTSEILTGIWWYRTGFNLYEVAEQLARFCHRQRVCGGAEFIVMCTRLSAIEFR
jgi:hypothetical protein